MNAAPSERRFAFLRHAQKSFPNFFWPITAKIAWLPIGKVHAIRFYRTARWSGRKMLRRVIDRRRVAHREETKRSRCQLAPLEDKSNHVRMSWRNPFALAKKSV